MGEPAKKEESQLNTSVKRETVKLEEIKVEEEPQKEDLKASSIVKK